MNRAARKLALATVRFRCTGAIYVAAWTEYNHRDNDFQSPGQGLLQKKVWFFAQGVETPGQAEIVNALNITLIVEYDH
jgi:hypothetical protein